MANGMDRDVASLLQHAGVCSSGSLGMSVCRRETTEGLEWEEGLGWPLGKSFPIKGLAGGGWAPWVM